MNKKSIKGWLLFMVLFFPLALCWLFLVGGTIGIIAWVETVIIGSVFQYMVSMRD